MVEPTVIVGICNACGNSIRPGTHFASSQMSTIFLHDVELASHMLCETYLNGLVEMELKDRLLKDPQFLAEYRRARLAEYLPKALFKVRRSHLMKEILMLRPNGPRLLVKRMDAPKPTSSLIEIPDTVDGEASLYALVLAVGTKCTENVNVADTVILKQYVGAPVTVTLDDETIDALIVMEEDVLAVVED